MIAFRKKMLVCNRCHIGDGDQFEPRSNWLKFYNRMQYIKRKDDIH